MKFKSLLLGSAAAMIAVSGAQSVAQAADAIIVEPEPMEYVKVCDMYGAGFFYIPGTETCMNINGFVRSTYSHAETSVTGSSNTTCATNDGFLDFLSGGTDNSVTNTSSWNIRGRLNFDVRNETEYG
ncbi:MAG: porin, partial [Salaquimonas sp.]